MGILEGKVAVITGGGSGIGRATVTRFLAEGASVVIGDLNETAGEETAETARDAGHERVRFVKTDVAQELDVERMIDLALTEFSRLDCVFNNTGVGGAFGPTTHTLVEDWDYTFGVLARGVFLGIKHGARAIAASATEGSIINTASIAAFSGGDAPIAYSSAKAAVVNMTRAAAVELAEKRIRVNCLCPGGILTPLIELALPTNAQKTLEDLQPWPEAGRPEDVAAAALFLAGDDCRFMTGATRVVDGGLSAAGARLRQRLSPLAGGADDSKSGVDRGSGLEPILRRVKL